MRLIKSLSHRLHSILHRDSANVELDEELRFHYEALVERKLEQGMTERQAREAARVDFGSFAGATQSAYEARGTAMAEDFAQDVRYGLRSMLRQPGFTVVVVLTLALGIAACTAIFSLVNAVMLRSLPYGDARRLVYLYTPNPHLQEVPPEAFGPANADFFDIRREARSFSSITMFEQRTMNVATADQPERIGVAKVDSSFFRTLETPLLLGRDFKDADLEPGNSHSVILSFALWQTLFGGDADVLNRTVTLDGERYSVAGVMPPGFGYPHKTDLPFGEGAIETTRAWIPYAMTAQQRADRDETSVDALARLAPGVTLQQAQAEMSAIVAHLKPQHHNVLFSGMVALVKPVTKQVLGPVRPLMLLLIAATGFVLLIACGNAANLLLARASTRRHELGVRATLGARRGRLIRQMLTESLLLGLAAGLAGTGMAWVLLHILLSLNPGTLPHMETASLDGRALVFVLLISLATSLLFGILPALSATRIHLAHFLANAGMRGVTGAGQGLRGKLAVTQVALVVMLLTGAGLFIRSYLKVLVIPTGFSPATVTMSVPMSLSADTIEKRRAFYTSLLDHILAQPGIQPAGLVNNLPLTDSESLTTLWVEGDPNRKGQLVEARDASAGYFTAMQTPVLRGRLFSPGEDSAAEQFVVIVNQAFANTYFAGKDPIGQHLRTDANARWSTIIGVVADVRYENIETAAVPQIFSPFLSSFPPPEGAAVVVRSSLPQASVIAALRSAVRTVDPGLAVSHIRLMSDLTAQANAPRRFQTTLLTVFSGIALFLAVVGVYGLMAYSVRQRTGEIGLRMALGATRSAIVRLVLREGFALVLAGLLIGMVGAIAFSRLLQSFLYEVPALDPIVLGLVPATLVVAVLGACLVPGIRAASVDAMVALRHE